MTVRPWGRELLAKGSDDDTWAISGDTVRTRGDLRAAVAETTDLFRKHGIGPGSRVALRLPPSWTQVACLLTLWMTGVQVILFDSRLKPREVAQLMELCEPEYEVSAASDGRGVSQFSNRCDILVRRRPSGRGAEDDCCLVQFSSGSTGLPKVIGRTGESLDEELERYARIDGMPAEAERVLLLASLIHAYGLVGGLLHGLNVGTTLVLPHTLVPADLLRVAAQRQVKAIFGVPAHFDLLRRVADPPALPALRLAVSAGERLDPAVQQEFAHTHAVNIGQIYGMTETGVIAGNLAGTQPPPAVGVVAPGVELKLDAAGVLYVRLSRSPYLMGTGGDRYVNGWLCTGDVGTRDPSTGVLTVLGRIDSQISIGGLKVDLSEIELALREHEDVHEAVVLYREGVEAYVGGPPSLSSDSLMVWCRERLSDYKIPKRFHVCDALPRTGTGKLSRDPELLSPVRGGTSARSVGCRPGHQNGR